MTVGRRGMASLRCALIEKLLEGTARDCNQIVLNNIDCRLVPVGRCLEPEQRALFEALDRGVGTD